jgi:hypothetical protein
MKSIAVIALVLGLFALAPHMAQAQSTANLSLASSEGYYVGESSFDSRNVAKEPERFLKDKSREPVDFLVLIENTSARDIAIYRQWNSWGYYSIHFVVESPDGKQKVIKKGTRAWTKNYPDCFRLPSGMTHAFPICFTSKEWDGVDALLVKGARIKAVFQQEPIEEKLNLGTGSSDVQIFTNKVESAFVVWEVLNARKAN